MKPLTSVYWVVLTLGLFVVSLRCESNLRGEEQANLVVVEFPLDSAKETRILATLESIAAQSSGGKRPVVVLEFRNAASVERTEPSIGRGTPFERSLGIARWLSSSKGARIQSIAFLPQSIVGHSVLIALACDDIAMAPDAEFGFAGLDEPNADSTVRQSYLDIASRKGAFPPAAIRSMLDPNESLVRIDLVGGAVEYKTISELESIQRGEKEWNESQLVPSNQLAKFLGQELRQWRWIAYLASNREQLQDVLRLSSPLSEKAFFTGPRIAIRTSLRGILNTRAINRALRSLQEGLDSQETNLIMIDIDSVGGNLAESIKLAQFLADIPAEKAEVVAYISGQALGDASLIALACDEIFMHPNAKLGGPGEATILANHCTEHRGAIESLAKSSGRPIGMLLGCLSQSVPVFEYRSFDGRTQLNSPAWIVDDSKNPQWEKGNAVDFTGGLNFPRAAELNIASDNAVSLDAVGAKFGIEKLPAEKQTNRFESAVDWLARQTWLSFLLFMIGITALSSELSAPGIGAGAIISAISFGLFFWLRFLDGTVEWLEILLILGGVVFLAIEILILPGFGVFGFSGIAMIGIGILLASQTFIIPTNDFQRQKVVEGLGQLGLITITLLGLAILFRKQIANSFIVKRMTLSPPNLNEDIAQLELAREQLNAYIGWKGRTLSRCNPTGKAVIGDKVFNVSSEGIWIDEQQEIVVLQATTNMLVIAPVPATNFPKNDS